MSKLCLVTGKRPNTANNVSHANNKTKRRQYPNMQKRALINPATGKPESIVVSARGLRSLKKWIKAGIKLNLQDLTA
ncbi:MAG: 50S ribosomal protein L28 [Patescibacteria group bacterium]